MWFCSELLSREAHTDWSHYTGMGGIGAGAATGPSAGPGAGGGQSWLLGAVLADSLGCSPLY